MGFSKILCRLGETALKSDYTRRFFEKKMVSNINKGLKSAKIDFSVRGEPGRLFIDTKEIDKACEVLTKVFGLTSISPVRKVIVKADMEKLVNHAEKFAKKFIEKGDSFAVRARRTGNQAFTSQMIERRVGERIVKNIGSRVDLENPDRTLYIEVRQNKAYFFMEKIKCQGGLPLGTQGNVAALFSGGIDSAVASWMMMKRGCRVFPLYIDSSPYVDGKKNLERAKKVLNELNNWSVGQKMRLTVIKNGMAMTEIMEKTRENLRCLLCKRMMYRIGERFCLKKKAKAIVTGENLGQVASQTLDNLGVLNQSIGIPVFRPLLGLNKEEIVKIAENIGTYEPSIISTGDCSAVPESPRTKGRIGEILREEKNLDIDRLVNKAMKTAKNF
ncbi:MAG: tRNA 4-thiouridine(8) synthase ThiI [archaeon]|nr:MAG: tRNA 4-thiouridine(8) synthase ThiI [archaeon]